MFERYTERARRVLFFARYEASQLGSVSIETEHLLLGLIREGKGLTSRIFARSHLSLEAIRKEVEGRTVFREKVSTSVEIPFSAETKRVLQFAAEEADQLSHNYIGTEHLLLGILREEQSVAATILMEKGMRLATVREDIVALLNEKTTMTRVKETPLLAEFSRDLSEFALKGVARPAGRARDRNRARAAGALPPDQEQRRADRRARCRQDGDRRGAGAEDRRRRRPALPRRQADPRARHLADRRRHEVSRPVRRTPQGDHEGAGRQPEHHRVHRRAAHAGRRGIGRGVAGCGQHPQAGAVARRDPVHRRDDAGRVSQVHREGPVARAALPGRQGGPAQRGRGDPDPARHQGALRDVPPRRLLARGARRGRVPVEPLHHRSLPARQGHRPARRGRRARQAARGGLQRGVRPDQPQHPRGGGADGERRLAEGLRARPVLPRAGSDGAGEPPVRAREVRRGVERAAGHGGPAGDRRGRVQVDGRAADLDQRGRRRQAAADGGGTPRARHQPGHARSPRCRAPSAVRVRA